MGDLVRLLSSRDTEPKTVQKRAGRGESAVPDADLSLSRYVDRYISGKKARGEINRLTASNHRFTLMTFARSFGRRPVDNLSRSDVERWIGEGNYTHSSQRTRLSTVRNFTRWMTREKILRSDPCVDLKMPRIPRSVPRTFEYKAVSALVCTVPDERARLIVLLMVQLGLRCVEVSRLELGDFTERYVTVNGKGGHQRILPVVPEVTEALNDYLIVRGGATGPLIQSYTNPGQALSRASISQYVNGWIREARIKRYRYDGRSAHGLRRTCATDMIQSGAEILDVKEALGHANVQTTMAYVAYDTSKLGRAMGGRHYGPGRQQGLSDVG